MDYDLLNCNPVKCNGQYRQNGYESTVLSLKEKCVDWFIREMLISPINLRIVYGTFLVHYKNFLFDIDFSNSYDDLSSNKKSKNGIDSSCKITFCIVE